MNIELVNKKNKKIVGDFAKNEWKKFNKEKDYAYNKEKYEHTFIENGKVYGYSEIIITGNVGYLSSLIVEKNKRRSGIGRELIKKFESLLKEKGCHKAYLETSDRHEEALKFYKKLGYEKVATLKKHKFGFNWYILEKKI